ncbi:CopG family ribbon-helix-helix protein [Blastomonas sp.]|uniref:CopG family ribbon-helix-helix protein n=1 Tax=Blastomonas sp. TaxID=1909299 RepID=UPI0035937844
MKTKKKPVKETLTVRIAPAKRRKLDKLATARKVDRSAVITAALDQYLAFEQWQIERIKEGLRQADAGEFATEDEVRKVFARFGV